MAETEHGQRLWFPSELMARRPLSKEPKTGITVRRLWCLCREGEEVIAACESEPDAEALARFVMDQSKSNGRNPCQISHGS